MSRRTERVAAELQSEIARVLREDVGDPRVALVTLTRVDVAPDLGNALVFWSAMGREGAEELDAVAEGLERATAFVQHQVAQRIPLRRMPALRFRHDPSLELGNRTLSILRELDERRPAPGGPESDGET